ncbi:MULTISPECIES: arylsulfatase [unclassified Mesorhizobium]|uniref:arylsulfatase n=1 Tax=unclassified Mesorhizobium TaxID=325217 RepID=UPI000FE9CBA6|nr:MULTISPECIES: arylsulfatase [unclassified Mesorhizobium]RWC78265.1 MAG: arylsulfatase [Mesorhizobium sp.]TGP93934.1 arylsulfatase [Mesorhizobium sp. M8A.F.Ca.ET.218.01.1.1]TGT18230.1 arylsulfatase [Mesorhizobium sp. M8A.F.Ca.ET.213.01.1.1]TIU48185.1 MAG: arylsulfatase [Mesorhizobium sp.]
MSKKPFKGVIKLDVRDSKADWEPYLPPRAPKNAPNVLIVLYDDTGQAAWSPYGGAINMPTLDRLAKSGLTYSQWHTTALCSPTRSTFLTGRNHHLNGMSCITEASNGFPGWSGRIPEDCMTIGQMLQENGYSTFWLGKDHNVPEQDICSGGPKSEWPVQKGFDRYYGFLGGETNQWYPDLVDDNKFIDQPYSPEEGYHLSKDLVDQAMQMIRDQKASNPSKPWFTWLCPGANHAPHHAPKEYIDKYKGKFDEGYDAYRKWVLPRMIEKGLLPKGTALTPFNPLPEAVANPGDMVRPWDELNADEKKLFSRMAEVYAGFSEYTDVQIGRLIDYLEQSGQLDNTIVFYCSDNGASGEGSPNGSVNENKFFNNYPDELSENLQYLDVLGGPETYNHYPTGWAAAFSTPYQMFKRYSEYAGGTCCPLVISWPKGIKAKGEVRNQYHHSTDIVPTILECIGMEMPATYRGVKQHPLSGVSMKYSFDAKPDAPTKKKRQYYAMLGSRGIWEDGWKAAALHAPLTGKGHFDKDEWELYHVDADRSEAKNVAKENPEKLKALIKVWFDEADANNVLPLDDRSAAEVLGIERPSTEPPRERYMYYPDTSPVPEGVAVNVRGRSYKILADVELGDKCEGVIFAHGSRFGGHSLFIKDMKLHYVYNFLGIKPEQTFVSKQLKPGKYTFGMEFIRDKKPGPHGESLGKTTLYVNDEVVAQGDMKSQLGKFTLSGDGLCIGRDSGDAVSEKYKSPGQFKGGTIKFVGVTVEKGQYLDLEKLAAAAMAVD